MLVDFLVGAGLKPVSIVSYNHLGNNDGKNLSAPQQFRSKEVRLLSIKSQYQTMFSHQNLSQNLKQVIQISYFIYFFFLFLDDWGRQISKSNVVDDMVESNKVLYKPGEKPDHCVVIKYVPYVGKSLNFNQTYETVLIQLMLDNSIVRVLTIVRVLNGDEFFIVMTI